MIVKKYASTIAAQITGIINILVTNNIITQYVSKIWEKTYGCAKHYISATYFYLLWIIAVNFNMIIDHPVGAHVNGKAVVDSLNKVGKNI